MEIDGDGWCGNLFLPAISSESVRVSCSVVSSIFFPGPVFCLSVCVCLVLCLSILVASTKHVHVHGNCYQNFVSLNFEVREFSSYFRGDFRLSCQFKFFCVIFLPISLKIIV